MPFSRITNRTKRLIAAAALGCMLAYGAGFLYLLLWGDRSVFEVAPPSYSECSFLKGKSGKRIAYRFVENPGAAFTMIYSHGSAADLGQLGTHIEAHRRFGMNVFIYDYPGIGLSDGPVSEQGCYETITEVFRHVRDTMNIPANRIVLYGRSIGTGPTLYLAEREAVAGVILVSPFTEALGVDTFTRIFPFEKFPNIKRVGKTKSPLLILHGKQDANIPWENAAELLAAAPAGTASAFLENCGHENIHLAPEYWKTLRTFSDTLAP